MEVRVYFKDDKYHVTVSGMYIYSHIEVFPNLVEALREAARLFRLEALHHERFDSGDHPTR